MLWLVPHLFPDRRLLELAAPGLHVPGLHTLLGRGTFESATGEGTEGALCRALGVVRQQDWPLAPISLQSEDGTAGGAYWLRADPAHFQVMRDRIVLAEVGMSDLTRDETDALAVSIADHFGAALPLHGLTSRKGYLRYARSPHLVTTPPSLAIGRPVDAVLPQGEDAAALRVQLNELQMLLHAHPVNLAREARGALPVNALWVWGGGVLPASAASARPVYADSPEAAALTAHCGARLHKLPATLERSMLGQAGVVLLDALEPAARTGDAPGWRHTLENLEKGWFAPLAGALRHCGPSGVQIHDPIRGRGIRLCRADAWKFWRRPRDLLSLPD